MEQSAQQQHSNMNPSEMRFWLDTYDDLFSDFDPRPHSQRAISDDFLSEAKRASRGKAETVVHLFLLMPHALRDRRVEDVITKRLRDHFARHAKALNKEKRGVLKQGLLFVSAGILVMIVASFFLLPYENKTALTLFLITLLEPAGWFLFWEGLNVAIFESKKINPDLTFYTTMTKCKIQFGSYGLANKKS